MYLLLFTCLTLLHFSSAIRGTNTFSNIWSSISVDYDAGFRPVLNPDDVVYVNVSVWLMSVIEVNEAHETIEMMQWVNLEWFDAHLQWDPSDFRNVSMITLPAHRLWQPDLNYEQQTDDLMTPIKRELLNADLRSDGQVTMTHFYGVRLRCSMNVVDFPFDTQSCNFTLATWEYEKHEVIVTIGETKNNTNYFTESAEWTLIEFSGRPIITLFHDEEYQETVWIVLLKRKSNYYVITLFMPTFVITGLCIVGLFSPSYADMHREERCSLGATTLLTMAVVLLVVSNLMPKSTSFPRLGRFIVTEMALTVFATMVSVIIIHFNALAEGTKYPPQMLLSLFRLKHPGLKNKQLQIPKGSIGKQVNIRSLPSNAYGHYMLLNSILFTLRELAERQRYKADREIRKLCWRRVCLRLDLIAMILFNTVNIMITIGYIMLPQFVF